MRQKVAWLIERGESDWVDRLELEVQAAVARIARFPEAAPVERQTERNVIRRARVGGLPYVILYVHTPQRPIREVWLARLLHYRQERTDSEPSDWPW